MLVARVTRRYCYGKAPHEVIDSSMGYYTDIEKARDVVKAILGKKAQQNNEFGFDEWITPDLPKIVYFIDLITVL